MNEGNTEILETPQVEPVEGNSQGSQEQDWKKRYSDSSREAQRLIDENKKLADVRAKDDALIVETYHQLVSSDASYLQKLNDTRPDLAEKLVKESFGFNSVEEALTSVK